jgi:hypothetical protein
VPQTIPNPLAQLRALVRNQATRLDAPAPLALWHLASLDAPTVAVAWSLAFARAAQIRLPAWIPVLLALAAWAVYIADRLLDARSAHPAALRDRHRFHHRHRRLLAPLAIAAALAAAALIFTLMPLAARERNSVLAVAALAYFTRVHAPAASRKAPLLKKEFLVGLLFTAACVLPTFNRALAQPRAPLWPFAAVSLLFALLAWLNCHAIGSWESPDPDLAKPLILTPACLLALAGLLLASLLASSQSRFAALAAAGSVSALFLALLDQLRPRLTPLALRAAADLVLLTPLALLVP